MKRSLLVVGLVLAGQAVAQQRGGTPFVVPNTDRIASLEDVDAVLDQLRKVPWAVSEATANQPALQQAEPGGRRMEDDLAEYVLTEQAQAALAMEREKLAAQGGKPVGDDSLAPVKNLVDGQVCRVMMILNYWSFRAVRATHSDLIAEVIGHMAEPDRPAARRQLDALNSKGEALRSRLGSWIAGCVGDRNAMRATMVGIDAETAPIMDQYNDLRASLLSDAETARRAVTVPLASRTSECMAPAPPRSGTGGPRIRSMPELDGFYPAEARVYGVTGTVRVRLQYDKTGCVHDAEVIASSGSPSLDMAGVKFGLEVSLDPAVVDGEPQEGGVIVPVRFNFRQ